MFGLVMFMELWPSAKKCFVAGDVGGLMASVCLNKAEGDVNPTRFISSVNHFHRNKETKYVTEES
jgi:hypothetical protein